MEKPYITVKHPASAEYIEKKSRFIATVAPVATDEEAREFVLSVKKKYPDARHNVYAYLTLDNMTRYSDDGEPKGTAGVPVLGVLQKSGIIGTAIVVTRYFGGILLGASGLVRAYTKAASDGVEAAEAVWVRPYERLVMRISYQDAERVKYALGHFDLPPYDIDYGDCAIFSLYVRQEEADGLISRLTDLTAGKAKIERAGIAMRQEN